MATDNNYNKDEQLTNKDEEQTLAGEENGSNKPLSKEDEEARQAIEAMRKFANESDDDSGEFSISSIIGGDFLMSKFVIKQIVFVMFCVGLMIAYTGNRYDSQKDTIVIDSLRSELQNVKYNVLTQSSELMNLIRQSNVEERLRHTKDSLLHNSNTPPFLIKLNESEVSAPAAETREVVIGEAPEPIEGEDAPETGEEESNNEENNGEAAASEEKPAAAEDANKKNEAE